MAQVYSLGEYGLISFLYYRYLLTKHQKMLKGLFITLTPLILLLHGISFQSIHRLAEYQTYGTLLVYALIVFYSGFFLFTRLSDTAKRLNRELMTLNVLIFCYYTVRLLIFSSINFMLNQEEQYTIYFWLLFASTVTTFYSALAFLLWKHGKNRKLLRFGWR